MSAESGQPIFILTVAQTTGSTPRKAGAKMRLFADGTSEGTIGGGKFEALVIAEALERRDERVPWLKSYPLHEASPDSFGAICGGEVVVFFEPQRQAETVWIVGAGHCAQAIAAAALGCGWGVVVLEDRADELAKIPRGCRVEQGPPEQFIASHVWQSGDALVLVSRNYMMDREALAAALGTSGYGYLGMIGSDRKVRRVFDELSARGFSREALEVVHAPIGIDIGAESPAEIAISVMAEVMQVLRKKPASRKAN